MIGRPTTHSIQPHLVNIAPVLIFRQLDAPFSTIFVRSVFPCGDDALLEKVIIGLLRQFRRLDDVVVQSIARVLANRMVTRARPATHPQNSSTLSIRITFLISSIQPAPDGVGGTAVEGVPGVPIPDDKLLVQSSS